MKKYVIGVDLGGTSVKLGLFSYKGDLLEKWKIPTNTEDKGKYILGNIVESIPEKLRIYGLTVNDLIGMGMDVPGVILDGGIVNKCVNVGWNVVPLRKELESALNGIRVEVGNDANTAALGEYWKGGGQGYKNMVMVTLGTGVGGGIILDGKVVTGAFGAAGEIGHIKVEKNEKKTCGCGKKGCLEQYASATGIVNMAEMILKQEKIESSLRRFGANLSAKDICDEAKKGDLLAIKVMDMFGEKLGRALSMISCVIDPEVYVIGGGMSLAGQIILDEIQKSYTKDAFHASRKTHFELAKLGNDAGIYGAVRMLLE